MSRKIVTEEINKLALQMVQEALRQIVDRDFGGDEAQLKQELKLGACLHCQQVSDFLAEKIAQKIRAVDPSVRSIHRYELEPVKKANSFSLQKDENPQSAGINLIVVTDEIHPSTKAWLQDLEKALISEFSNLGCEKFGLPCFFLDAQFIEEKYFSSHRGLGLLTHGCSVRSIPIQGPEPSPENPSLEEMGEHVEWQQRILQSIDLELTPEYSLFERASEILRLPENQRDYRESELREIKVALIRKLISDQLAYINLAKEWLTFADLEDIYRRRVGLGRIGGKSAGLILANRILQDVGDETIRTHIHTPESFYLGSDLIYIFMAMNGLMHWNNQKYSPEENIRNEYAQIQQEFEKGTFPPEILSDLQQILEKIGNKPLIVRSSSQLEDNFGTSFAGKYDSFFCPNQDTPENNLTNLVHAIAKTYASTLKPDALLYRRSKGLQDYDERMAILIQVVEGSVFCDYYLPFASGVAFGRNLYRWAPQIRREAGFTRLVWGLGTRAVDRVGNDYPHLVALSHPLLQPDDSPESIRYYSQQFVDLIDLKNNSMKTLPIKEVLTPEYPEIRYLVQKEEDGFFSTPRSRVLMADIPKMAITFDELLRKTKFAELLAHILHLLDERYRLPVDMEYTIELRNPDAANPDAHITLLQCRPQSRMINITSASLPKDLPAERIAFRTNFMVPQGYLPDIQHVLFVSPEEYHRLTNPNAFVSLTRAIQELNKKLADKKFICVGPGRWGTTNSELGVYVTYADIFHAAALIELSGKNVGVAPEPSLGTHFFQDLMEAQIYPLSINLDNSEAIFNRDFFYNAPNHLKDFLPTIDESITNCLRVITVSDFKEGNHLDIFMDDEKSLAVALFARH